MQYTVKGFPEISEPVEMPSIGELLISPMLSFATPEEVYQYGSSAVKHLFEKTPLKNDRKYVFVASNIQFLSPNVRTVANNAVEGGNNWHIDAFHLSEERADRHHILFSDCSALTEFNVDPFMIDVDELNTRAINVHINQNIDKLNITGKKIPAHTFATFTTNLHRRTSPQCHEFRYWLRVFETDIYPQQRKGTPYRNVSYVVSPHGVRETVEHYTNIEQSKDGKITIHVT